MACSHGEALGSLSEESKGTVEETIRDYEPEPGTPWRFGLPNYAVVNKAYFEGRSKRHAAGSLEAIVEKLVKNWEVESHHISDIKFWKTMDVAKFQAFSNGEGPVDAATMCAIGPYNMLLGDMHHYQGSAHSFEGANDVFRQTFGEGFAWEVLEVYSGPPNVSFTWRHFGRMTGDFKGCPATGKVVNMVGHCLARVSKDLVIEEFALHFDREGFIAALTCAGVFPQSCEKLPPPPPT